MPLFLSSRKPDLREWMDDPNCDTELLNRTYSQFSTLNRLISGWQSIYRSDIRPLCQNAKSLTILDIGCGGGDLIRHLDQLSKNDGFEIHFTGVDPDERAIRYARSTESPPNIQYLQTTSTKLANDTADRFDLVISNHLLHHLSADDLLQICRDSEELAKRGVIFNDIERGDIGFAAFSTVAPMLFRNSFIVKDGKISIRRSYTKKELSSALPGSWKVHRKFPYRLIATRFF